MNIYKIAFLVLVGAGISLSLYAAFGGNFLRDPKKTAQAHGPAKEEKFVGPSGW